MSKYYIVKRRYNIDWYWNRKAADWDRDVTNASVYGTREIEHVVRLPDGVFWREAITSRPAGE